MHGRLKIKTTAQQDAEKKKEREEKQKLYLGGLKQAFSKRSSGVHDEEGLKVTAQLLMANPDALTLWNFRREILLDMKSKEENFKEVMLGELSMIEQCLMRNPKSYGAWHHRGWVMENSSVPPWEKEVELCDKYLKKDERNFHCWDYRRIVVAGSGRNPEMELKTSQELIERNLSNFSAWHYRSKLLPLVHPPKENTPHPIAEETLVKELGRVVEAVFTDPSDQSPWLFLRWLVNRMEGHSRLLQVGYKKLTEDEGTIVYVFSKQVSRSEIPQIKICYTDPVEIGINDWCAPINGEYSYVWFSRHKISASESEPVKCQIGETTLTMGVKPECVWLVEPGQHQEPLTDLTRSTLEEVVGNCQTIDELDPGTKWVLLTIVDVMWALDATKYQSDIMNYLNQLQELDPLRNNYYADMKSKLIVETTLKDFLLYFTPDKQFSIINKMLTRVPLSHLLACATSVDLSRNNLTSLLPITNLVMCEHLNLDNNCISDISPLSSLSHLTKISLAENKLESVESLSSLRNVVNLSELTLTNNPLCKLENVEESVKSLLPQVNVLNL